MAEGTPEGVEQRHCLRLRAAAGGLSIVKGFKTGSTASMRAKLDAMRRALNDPGMIFIAENGEGARVRLRKANGSSSIPPHPSFSETIGAALNSLPKMNKDPTPDEAARRSGADNGQLMNSGFPAATMAHKARLPG